jgi:hypothetical protein
MVNIKRFFDRVSAMESKPGRDLVIPSAEAKALRDEIAKLLIDKVETASKTSSETTVVQLSGGNW